MAETVQFCVSASVPAVHGRPERGERGDTAASGEGDSSTASETPPSVAVEHARWVERATWCGIVAPIVALGSVVLATLVAPAETFTWANRALSDLGRHGAETFWLFNGGLIVGGLVGVPFGWRLWIDARTRVERAGILALAAAVLAMIGVGIFFLDHTEVYLETDLHVPVAVGFFLLAPLSQWLYGVGSVLSGDASRGWLSAGLGTVHPIAWVGWVAFRPEGDPTRWFAVPEFVAAIAFGGWILWLAVTLRGPETPPGA